MACSVLPDVHQTSTLTEAALLSGTPRKEHAKGARGGLLPTIGEFGLIVCKDLTSMLSMHRDAQAEVLAALREVYDGEYTRHVGTEGGRKLSWSGKVGLLAGCTETIDRPSWRHGRDGRAVHPVPARSTGPRAPVEARARRGG